MSMMAETYMLQALRNGFSSIKQNPAQLADILTALNADELAVAQQWFGNLNLTSANIPNTNRLIIAPGFPNAPELLPFIGVTVAEERQLTEQTGIGLNYYETIDPTTGAITRTRGARFSGTLKATIYTPNADLAIWLSAVCKWALLSQYDWFASDEVGMNNISITVGDFEPQPGFLPIFTFARGVFLSAEYDQVFTETPHPITSLIADGSFSIYPSN